MQSRQEQITNLMWKEVAAKGPVATMAFSFIALVVYFYHFGDIPSKEWVKSACLLIIMANTLRLWISKKIDPELVASAKNRNILRVSVWLNAIGWSTVFSVAAIERAHEPLHFSVMLAIMFGFLTASIITLAYDRSIYFPFQLIILLPINAIFLHGYITGSNSQGGVFIILFIFYFLYQVRQYQDYRQQLFQRFSYQIDLELSLEEIKRSQKAFVEQTAKLMHASKISALGDMAGGLAHEVNNSLMVILGSTQQIERQLKQKELLDGGMRSKIDQTTNSIMRIKSVVEGLKNFSLQMEPTPKEATDLNEIIQRTLNYCQELLNAHNIRFDVAPVPEVMVKAQPFQIIQILFNLMKNADDAVSHLEADDRWIQFAFELQGRDLLIKVINGGPRIQESSIDKLFQPFFTTKDVNKGTGLSLSISKGFAMEHKGDLYLESGSAHTTFVLRLPLS